MHPKAPETGKHVQPLGEIQKKFFTHAITR